MVIHGIFLKQRWFAGCWGSTFVMVLKCDTVPLLCSHYHNWLHNLNRVLNRGVIVVILSDIIRS